jgi:hypothetical protein
MVHGFYIVSYGLGIYLLNLLIGFLSPMVDPELDPSAAQDGPALPTRGSDEFKPFIRRLPEFKFWYVPESSTLASSSSPPTHPDLSSDLPDLRGRSVLCAIRDLLVPPLPRADRHRDPRPGDLINQSIIFI